MKETLFYVLGIVLAISAVIVSFIGLKAEKFPGKLTAVVIVWFGALAIAAATFAVLYSQEHAEHRAHTLEHANEEVEAESGSEPFEEEEERQKEGEAEEEAGAAGQGEEAGEEAAGGEAVGGGGTLQVTANESALAYEEKSLETQSGEVEINFDNPSAIPHDVVVEQNGDQIGATEVITEDKDSTTLELEKGDYVFYCSVPGHREAGMEGPLTVR